MLDYQEMSINYGYASADTEMRDACLEDIERFFINGQWWRGNTGESFKNKPKPEFNKLWRSINRVCGDINDMELNATIISNSDDATDEDADLLARRWRNDFQASDGIEASEIATQEAIIGGMGCVKLASKYEDEENPDPDKQYLCAEIVHSACTSVVFDAGAIRKDKADAKRAWHLIRVNRRTTEEEYSTKICSFMNPPSSSYGNDSILDLNSTKDVYLAHYYEVIEKNLTVHDMSAAISGLTITTGDGTKDQNGQKYTRDEFNEIKQDYEDLIGEPAPTIRKKVKFVEYALCDGEKYLTKPQRMPFKRVPLFPRYGYYKVINGQEFYCGEVRKQLDNEMFMNQFGSAMMQILAADQVGKPEYTPEQIARHANQRAKAESDNAPFVMSDPIKDASGNPVHFGPIGMTQPPQAGTGFLAAGQFLENNNLQMGAQGNASVPANASGDAIQQVNERQDDAFLPIVKNVLHSISAQCEGWIPAAQTLYFTNQRRLRVQEASGKYSQVTTLEMSEDSEGNYGPYKNSARGRYTVQVSKGEAYKDQRQTERESNIELLQYAGSDTEMGQLILMSTMQLTDGEGGDSMRQVARYKEIDLLLQMGVPFKPENEEEEQYIQQKIQQMEQASQQQQEDPAIMLERMKEQNIMLSHQNKQAELQLNVAKFQVETQGKQSKQLSDNQMNYVNAQQKQQQIDIEAKDKQFKNALDLTKLEIEAGKDLNNSVQDNMLVFDPAVGDFV